MINPKQKSKRRNPIHHLSQIKSGARLQKHTKIEDKLYKLITKYEDLDVVTLAKEFQVTFEDSFMKSIVSVSTRVDVAKMARNLETDLGWEAEKSLERSILFAFETDRAESIKLDQIVRKLRGGNKFEVQLEVEKRSTKMTIETATLMKFFKMEIECFESNQKTKQKPKAVKNKLISEFVVEKRKLNSPNRAPNPSLLKKVQLSNAEEGEKENNFSLGLDDLVDNFNDSMDLDDYVPLSVKINQK